MMHKYWQRWRNETHELFCVVFLVVRVSAFAEPDSHGNDIEMHQTTGADNTASWQTQDLPNMRLRFKLPHSYKQKQWAVAFGSGPIATFRLGDFNQIDFRVENARNADPENAKVGLQRDYVDYKEWQQLLDGHKWVVQTFQGGGQIIDEKGKRSPYCVHATCAPDEKRLLSIHAVLESPERQQEVLAMLKTIEFY